jgi:hypothetical protein
MQTTQSNPFEGKMFDDIYDLIIQTFPRYQTKDLAKLPSADELNSVLNKVNDNNKRLKFACQDSNLAYIELGYELRIYKHGIIAYREKNWHDFFNALVWLKFPETKTILNSIHYHEIQNQSSNQRSEKRDILTLFDECGVLVQADQEILQLIKEHKWQELFIDNSQLWLDQKIKVTTFGHAMYEKYLSPYIGMTAKAILLPNHIKNIDTYLANKITNCELLYLKTELYPLPLLGIPKWHPKQTSEFYNNKNYFR